MLSQLDRQFLRKQFKILPSDPNKWHKQQYSRLLALIKLPEAIQKQFYEHGLQNSDIKNLSTILQRLQPSITEHTYFPFHKLKSCINLLAQPQDDTSPHSSSLLQKPSTLQTSQFFIKQPHILQLTQSLNKLPQLSIIELTSEQVAQLLKGCGLVEYATLCRKYSVDGFNLVCSLADWDTVRDIRNYYEDGEIGGFLAVSCLFVAQYWRQIVMDRSRRKTQYPELNKKQVTQVQDQIPQKDKQYIIQASQIRKKYSEQDIEITQMQANEQGESMMGTSQVGISELTTSEMGQSEYQYPRGSGSVYAQSVYEYADSVRGSVDCRMSFRVGGNDGRASLMYNSEILNQLKDAALSLGFDLLNLEPLQQIKIRALKTAFGKELDKDFWIFSVKGAKLGRDKQNDIRFPDELSISGKHAQILFKNEVFFLQDLGSKTGTYIKIQQPIPIEDEICVQFSTDVEIIFRIIQKNQSQGIIKAEIKKPENLPDYKISLKENYKIKIGRSERCHIRVNNTALAQKHSEIYYRDGGFFFKNCHVNYMSWLRLSQKSLRSQTFKIKIGDVVRLSSKKSFLIEGINNFLIKSTIQ